MKKPLTIAKLGWEACVQYGQYASLPSTLEIIADVTIFFGDDEKSKDYYRRACYLYKAVRRNHGIDN